MSEAGHIEPEFGPADLEAASPAEREQTQRHLAGCPDCSRAFDPVAEAWASLALALDPVAPSDGLWARLEASVQRASRFDHLAERVARALDLRTGPVRAFLAAIDDPARWMPAPAPGVFLFHIDPGPRLANAVCGFIRLQPGATFPHHKHLGDEHMLILQGAYSTDTGEAHVAGDDHFSPGGFSHEFTAAPGEDLIYLGVVEAGIYVTALQLEFLPGDPRI